MATTSPGRPDALAELESDEIAELIEEIYQSTLSEEYLNLADETYEDTRPLLEQETLGYSTKVTIEGVFKILAVPFEGVPSGDANVVVVYQNDAPIQVFSSKIRKTDSELAISRFEVIGGEIKSGVSVVNLANLRSIGEELRPKIVNPCQICKNIVQVAKFVGCSIAPGAICTLASVPQDPIVNCGSIAAGACHIIGRKTDTTKEDVCRALGLCQ